MTAAIIEVRDLVKRFDGRAVLAGVNLDVLPGETLVVMGGSGCGKRPAGRTLEDAFIALTGHSIREAEAAPIDRMRMMRRVWLGRR